MPLRIRILSRFFTACAAIAIVSLIGCRQLGTRSTSPTPLPSAPEAPTYSPGPDLGPSLQEIPPLPPAAARRSAPQQSPIDIPESLLSNVDQSAADEEVSLEIAPVAAEENFDDDEDLAALIPPAAASDDAELVPVPRDLEDDEALVESAPRLRETPLVQLDVAEFLAELEQTPSPVKALTLSREEVAIPAPIRPVVASPVASAQNIPGIEPWPAQGLTHGIAVTPGPTGTGNRLEYHTTPVWNQGRIAYPAPMPWGAVNQWAGQNSDWGGRQFR